MSQRLMQPDWMAPTAPRTSSAYSNGVAASPRPAAMGADPMGAPASMGTTLAPQFAESHSAVAADAAARMLEDHSSRWTDDVAALKAEVQQLREQRIGRCEEQLFEHRHLLDTLAAERATVEELSNRLTRAEQKLGEQRRSQDETERALEEERHVRELRQEQFAARLDSLASSLEGTRKQLGRETDTVLEHVHAVLEERDVRIMRAHNPSAARLLTPLLSGRSDPSLAFPLSLAPFSGRDRARELCGSGGRYALMPPHPPPSPPSRPAPGLGHWCGGVSAKDAPAAFFAHRGAAGEPWLPTKAGRSTSRDDAGDGGVHRRRLQGDRGGAGGPRRPVAAGGEDARRRKTPTQNHLGCIL